MLPDHFEYIMTFAVPYKNTYGPRGRRLMTSTLHDYELMLRPCKDAACGRCIVAVYLAFRLLFTGESLRREGNYVAAAMCGNDATNVHARLDACLRSGLSPVHVAQYARELPPLRSFWDRYATDEVQALLKE